MRFELRILEKPRQKDPLNDIDWICDSLGFSSGRDISLTMHKILREILQKFAEEEAVYSETLARELNLNKAIVNHHLRTLIDSGLVYRERRQIVLRGGSLKEAIKEMKKDFERMFEEIEEIATDVDHSLGIKNR